MKKPARIPQIRAGRFLPLPAIGASQLFGFRPQTVSSLAFNIFGFQFPKQTFDQERYSHPMHFVCPDDIDNGTVAENVGPSSEV